MASEEELTSDSLDTTETDIPEALLGYLRDQVVGYIKQTKFSAKFQHTEGQSPKLVLSFESKDHRNCKSISRLNLDGVSEVPKQLSSADLG